MFNSNLHKMPANFNSERRGHPFKVFLTKEKDIYKCSIDKLSMVYSFFDDKEVKIDGIDTKFTVKKDDKLILTINCTNKGLIITSASLSIKTGLYQEEFEREPCFPGDEYYTGGGPPIVGDPECLKSLDIRIALFQEYTKGVLTVTQFVRKHITRYGPGIQYNQL